MISDAKRIGLAALLVLFVAAAAPHGAYRHHGPALLPDARVTPGAVTRATKDELCSVHFRTANVRNVSESEKKTVFMEYSQTDHRGTCRDSAGRHDGCEVDHLISLELGGSNDIRNLWPQPSNPVPGFHQKDVLENELHRLVCAGKIPLSVAQHGIASDWYAAYQEYGTK